MKETKNISRSRAQESSAAIEKCTSQCAIYSTGFYKPMGISGDTLREALLAYVRKYTETLQKKK
jgi:hypothetical protein